MPIYEYRCSSCGHQQEYLLKVSDPPRTTCPSCGKEALTKMVTAAGFQLKGSGWYATDFKGKGSKPSTSRASGEANAGEATSGAQPKSGGDANSGGGATSGAESKSGNAAPEGKAKGSKAGSGGGSS
jgi:putative FmdB family regulatory protein